MLHAPRSYQGEADLNRIYALQQAGRAAQNGSYYPHTGDLKWWFFYHMGTSYPQHIYVWEDPEGDNSLLGWALLDPDGESYDVYYQPELYGTALAEEMYCWTEEAAISTARASGRKQVGVFWVTPEDSFHAGWLEERGYKVTNYDPALACSLAEAIPEAPVPQGFQARACRGVAEVEARARAQYSAFDNSLPFEQYLQRFTRFMQSPAYASAGDIVTAHTDGRIASFCITWTDPVNRVGLFEPVGTHPDFQRKGLGKAVMLEALRRLQRQGMQQAIVCTAHTNEPALRLYEAVGFRQYSVFNLYTKDLD